MSAALEGSHRPSRNVPRVCWRVFAERCSSPCHFLSESAAFGESAPGSFATSFMPQARGGGAPGGGAPVAAEAQPAAEHLAAARRWRRAWRRDIRRRSIESRHWISRQRLPGTRFHKQSTRKQSESETDPVNPNDPRNRNPFPESGTVRAANQEVARLLVSGTGGLEVRNTNDLLAGIEKIGKEQNEYYLIGYTPPPSTEESCHKLRVQVNRGGVDVRARPEYCNAKPRDVLSGTPSREDSGEPGSRRAVRHHRRLDADSLLLHFARIWRGSTWPWKFRPIR